jgi:2-polyprenyl-3-methyl-5-hydroxy-6-metoxy-1,4-benzoquinol methylase
MNESMENALRYHIEVDLSQGNTSHAQLIRLTGRNKQVLEVGPATGYVTKVLRERGCRVWCIENDAEAAKVAAEYSEGMVIADVEALDFASTFQEERFDVVTFGDVLEHLVDPTGVLVRVKEVLKPGGYVVASVPNIAHASIRLSLLRGQFQYTEMGLLDRTHLRFFTRDSLAGLFADAGYEVRAWRRVLTDPFATEVDLREENYPAYLREAARGDLEALTYQFVVSAYPAGPRRNGRKQPLAEDTPERNLLEDLWRWQKEHQAKESSLAQALAERNAALADREERLARRERLLQKANADLDAITRSLGYKLLESCRQPLRWLFPKAARSRRKAKGKATGTPATSAGPSVEARASTLTEAQYYRRQLTGYCLGTGIELGALHAPTQGLPPNSAVLYVDKESRDDLVARFAADPNVAPDSLSPVDVVADARSLPFQSGSLDFLIANHVIEHLANPLGTLSEWYRCLKDGGHLYMSVPDKRYCFDSGRELTTWAHLLEDMQRNDDGFSDASREHLSEWVRVVEGLPEDEVDARVEHHLSMALDYHFHTWTYESMLGTLDRCAKQLGIRFEREAELNSYETWGEMILVLRKNGDAVSVLPAPYSYPEWEFTDKDRILGELLPGTTWAQSFTCGHNGLNAIHVRFATYSRANSGPLVFQLFVNGSTAPLARLETDLAELRDNFFHAFRFPTVAKSAGKRFHFTIEAPNSSPDNAVTVWATARDASGVSLKVNESPILDTTLNFKAFSIARLDERNAWSGRQVPPSPRRTNGRRRLPGALRQAIGKGAKTR